MNVRRSAVHLPHTCPGEAQAIPEPLLVLDRGTVKRSTSVVSQTMRVSCSVLLLAFLAHLLVPACIVVDFLLDQDRIAKELCVQRLVPDEMRTCHGHCYLSKKLNDVDARERDLPGTLRSWKLDDAVPQQNALRTFVAVAVARFAWPEAEFSLSQRCVPVSEPVPWC